MSNAHRGLGKAPTGRTISTNVETSRNIATGSALATSHSKRSMKVTTRRRPFGLKTMVCVDLKSWLILQRNDSVGCHERVCVLDRCSTLRVGEELYSETCFSMFLGDVVTHYGVPEIVLLSSREESSNQCLLQSTRTGNLHLQYWRPCRLATRFAGEALRLVGRDVEQCGLRVCNRICSFETEEDAFLLHALGTYVPSWLLSQTRTTARNALVQRDLQEKLRAALLRTSLGDRDVVFRYTNVCGPARSLWR